MIIVYPSTGVPYHLKNYHPIPQKVENTSNVNSRFKYLFQFSFKYAFFLCVKKLINLTHSFFSPQFLEKKRSDGLDVHIWNTLNIQNVTNILMLLNILI